MFDFDAGKLIVIGIVALIAIPSKDLPRVLRTLGQVMGRTRRMAAEFQGQLMDALREAELADLKKEFEETNRRIMDSVKVEGAFDPLAEARKQIVRAVEDEPRPEATQSATETGEGPPLAAFVETPPDAPRDEGAETPPPAPQDEAPAPSDKKAAP